jgi:hypothetical protein
MLFLSEPLIPMITLITLIFFNHGNQENQMNQWFRQMKNKNADRSPYATMAENDRRMNLKGLVLILGRTSCLLS